MSYVDDLQGLADALSSLQYRGSDDLHATEIDIALAARRGTLDLLRTVHRDLAGPPMAGVPTARDLERHPVAALGWALTRYPQPRPDGAPTDVFTTTALTTAGELWQDAARHALLARYAWPAVPPEDKRGAAAWAGIADVAAIARQLVSVDPDLLAAVRAVAPDRPELHEALRNAATSGLGVTAREAARLAAAGVNAKDDSAPTPEQAPQQQYAGTVVVPLSPQDVLVAQQRTAAFLAAAEHLRPERLQHLAITQARSCLLIEAALPVVRDPALEHLGAELRKHAVHLGDVVVKPSQLTSIQGGDPRPLHQAAAVYKALPAYSEDIAADRRLLADYVRAVADTSQALAAAANRSVTDGRWMVPDNSHDVIALTWRTLRVGDPVPRAVAAVDTAARHSTVLHEAARALTPPSPTALPAGWSPAQAHHARSLTVDAAHQRPPRPSQPVVPGTRSRRGPSSRRRPTR